jgi:hypothetical protein
LRGASHGRGWRIDSFAVIWRSEFECAVWPLLVVVAEIDAEDVLELAAAEDEHLVEALSPCAADPALDVRVRVRRPERRPNDPHLLAVEDGVEGAAELGVAVVD